MIRSAPRGYTRHTPPCACAGRHGSRRRPAGSCSGNGDRPAPTRWRRARCSPDRSSRPLLRDPPTDRAALAWTKMRKAFIEDKCHRARLRRVSRSTWPTCGVCGLSHRPARFNNGGPARCWHCGRTEQKCQCGGGFWRRLVKRVVTSVHRPALTLFAAIQLNATVCATFNPIADHRHFRVSHRS